ncbi:MAG: hypothetical protein HC941_27280 [Microcoleus sp. SU_5_3]|nr:hypothetical protein [Microcoleus sp. SU_5_3]
MKHHTTPQYPYDSIGDMYDALVTGIKQVGENQFSWKTTNQQALWDKEPFKQKIEVPGDVHDAVTTISLQGEGKTTAEGRYAIPPKYRLEDKDDSGSLNEHSHYERLLEIENRHLESKNQESILDRKFPDVYDVSTATDEASKNKQHNALDNLQKRFATLLKDLDNMWNQGMTPDDTHFWSDMCDGLLPAAEECWKAGVVPKWS